MTLHLRRDFGWLIASLALCLGFFGSANAQHWSRAGTGCNSCCVSLSEPCGFTCCQPCADPCSNLCDCVWGRGEFLYWQTKQSNLDYAADHGTSSSIIGAGKQHYLEYQWDPGFRATVGIRPGRDCCWELRGVWTHMYSVANGSTGSPTGGDLKATLVHPGAGGGALQTAASAFGYNKLNYDTGDLLVQTTCCCNSCLKLTPFAGLRYLRLDQILHVEYAGSEFATNGPGVIKWVSDFKGFGVHGGLDFELQLCKGFSTYGGFGGSLIAMRSKIKHRDQLVGDTPATHVDIRENECRIIPGGNISLGVRYECELCGCKFGSRLGYEFHQWLRTPEVRRYMDDANPAASRAPGNGDIAFHGVTVGVQFGY